MSPPPRTMSAARRTRRACGWVGWTAKYCAMSALEERLDEARHGLGLIMVQHVARVLHSLVTQAAEGGAPRGLLGGIHLHARQRVRLRGVHPQHRGAHLSPDGAHLLEAVEQRVDDLVLRVAAQHHLALL